MICRGEREKMIYSPKEFPVRCEVFSRVVGYIRPVRQWNDAKREEFEQRKTFEQSIQGKM